MAKKARDTMMGTAKSSLRQVQSIATKAASAAAVAAAGAAVAAVMKALTGNPRTQRTTKKKAAVKRSRKKRL